MVVDVLKVQPGDNLTEILYTPATPEQVKIILLTDSEHTYKHGCFGNLTQLTCSKRCSIHLHSLYSSRLHFNFCRRKSINSSSRKGKYLTRPRCYVAKRSKSLTRCLEIGSKYSTSGDEVVYLQCACL